MQNQQQFDILIIGSGESGKHLSWTMAKGGRSTAVVERKLIGGSCPNIACLPSKNVIHSAKVAQLVARAAEFGITIPAWKIDMAGVRARKRQMVQGDIAFHLDKYKACGVELIMGEARFVGPKTVEVRTKEGAVKVLKGVQVFLNVGTHAAVPDIPGLKAAKPLTHIEALELDRTPEHLIVLGGGFVGLELAQAMRRFGSRITILERGPQLGGREDPDVTQEIYRLMRDEGFEIMLHSELLAVEGLSGREIRMRVRDSAGERTIVGSDILVATGRVPNTQGLGLAETGVELNERGFIRVDERLQTTAPGIWAMGECAGSPQFTHVAFDDFRVVHENLTGGHRTTHGRLVPFCLFTDPELAHVGLSESEAEKQQIRYRLAKIPTDAVLRAHTLSETRGFLKALVGANSDEILGFTAFAPAAGELMSVVQTAMLAKQPYTALRDTIFAHPTMAEALTTLFAAVPARSAAGAS
jgi:pyruvate/2-oxoglutarate dehydrogenase complex dihydrolipoamide dehydrogenase (E3) component